MGNPLQDSVIETEVTTRVEDFRKSMNLSVEDFAGKIGLKPGTYRNMVSVSTTPISKDTIFNILNRFPELSAEWLIRGRSERFVDESEMNILGESRVEYSKDSSGDSIREILRLVRQIDTDFHAVFNLK